MKRSVIDSVDTYASEKDQGVVAMVGLDAMKRANSTLEDFVSLYSFKTLCLDRLSR